MSMLDFNQKEFLREVRAFMKKHNLSCRRFTELSKVSFATLYYLEQGKHEITLSTIRKLQKAMNNFKV